MKYPRFLRRGPSKSFLWSLCFCLVIALATVVISPPCDVSQCPRIEAQEKPSEGVKSQTTGQQAVAPHTEGNPDKPYRGEQTTEGESTWHILWWRFKASEVLLIFFAGALWIATRDLVAGAEETAERQLRAYPGITG